jgi:hypothetical protein
LLACFIHCPLSLSKTATLGTHRLTLLALLKALLTSALLNKHMSEYTHNDDVAELLYQNERDLNKIIYAKDQEIEVLKRALDYCNAELDRLEKEHARGF